MVTFSKAQDKPPTAKTYSAPNDNSAEETSLEYIHLPGNSKRTTILPALRTPCHKKRSYHHAEVIEPHW